MKNRPKITLTLLFLAYSCFAQKVYQKNYFDNGKIKSEGWIENDKKEKFRFLKFQN